MPLGGRPFHAAVTHAPRDRGMDYVVVSDAYCVPQSAKSQRAKVVELRGRTQTAITRSKQLGQRRPVALLAPARKLTFEHGPAVRLNAT
jgi:hypothetical protein